MNIIDRVIARFALPSALAVCLLVLAGCLEQRVIWSPGGEHAVVLTSDGDVYLCDASGALTGKLATEVKLASWLGDARLVLARQQNVSDWASVSAALGADRGRIEALGQKTLAALEAGTPWEKLAAELKESADLVKIWLRDVHPHEVQPKLSPDEWHSFRPGHASVKVTTLVTATVTDRSLEAGPALQTFVGDVVDLRPSRHGRVLAWAQSASDGNTTEIRALRFDHPGEVVTLVPQAAGYPDWTPDGKSLVYVSAPPGPTAEDKGLAIGIVTRRLVLDESDRIVLGDKPEYLAGVVFSGTTRVRCLRDGRILFNAPEITFPLAAADYEGEHREQFFAIDPARQSTVVRLIPRGRELDVPELLSFYDVSPDERQVLFAGFKNELAVLTLASGAVDSVQEAGKDLYQGIPTWRSSGEICYVKVRHDADKAEGRSAEIVLRRGNDETVLSRSWPSEILERVSDRQKR